MNPAGPQKHQVATRVDAPTHGRLVALAAERGVTVAALLVHVIRAGLTEVTGAPKPGDLRTEQTAHGIELRMLIDDPPLLAVAAIRAVRHARKVLAPHPEETL